MLKEEQKLEKEMNGYMNWICKAGELILSLQLLMLFKTFNFFTFKEDLVLAEERTSKKDRQRIMEGAHNFNFLF